MSSEFSEEKKKKEGLESNWRNNGCENFLNLARDINTDSEAKWIPSRIKPKISMPRHIIGKLLKTKAKESIMEVAREKQRFTYCGETIQTSVAFTSENVEMEIIFFKCWKKTTGNPESYT